MKNYNKANFKLRATNKKGMTAYIPCDNKLMVCERKRDVLLKNYRNQLKSIEILKVYPNLNNKTNVIYEWEN